MEDTKKTRPSKSTRSKLQCTHWDRISMYMADMGFYQVLYMYIMASILVMFIGFLCINEWCLFLVASFGFFNLFFLNPIQMYQLLFYLIFYYYLLEACLFSNKKQKGSRSGWEARGEMLRFRNSCTLTTETPDSERWEAYWMPSKLTSQDTVWIPEPALWWWAVFRVNLKKNNNNHNQARRINSIPGTFYLGS